MLLNNTRTGQPSYDSILTRFKQRFPNDPLPSKRGLTEHKVNHLLSQPIAVESEDGTLEYFGGQQPVAKITVKSEQVPELPELADLLRIIIGAGVHNILHDPSLVTPAQTILAIDALRKLEGPGNSDELLKQAWSAANKTAVTTVAPKQLSGPATEYEESGWSVDAMISEAESG